MKYKRPTCPKCLDRRVRGHDYSVIKVSTGQVSLRFGQMFKYERCPSCGGTGRETHQSYVERNQNG